MVFPKAVLCGIERHATPWEVISKELERERLPGSIPRLDEHRASLKSTVRRLAHQDTLCLFHIRQVLNCNKVNANSHTENRQPLAGQ